jgi:hypothetical protein
VTDTAVELKTVEPVDSAQPGHASVSDEQLVAILVERARTEGLQLTGQDGLLQQLTKRVLESALEVKTVKTAADGTLSTTVRAYADGDYRWSYAGTDATAAAVSEGDFVDVR